MTIPQLQELLNTLTEIMVAFQRCIETTEDEEKADDAARIYTKAARLKRAILTFAHDFPMEEEHNN